MVIYQRLVVPSHWLYLEVTYRDTRQSNLILFVLMGCKALLSEFLLMLCGLNFLDLKNEQ